MKPQSAVLKPCSLVLWITDLQRFVCGGKGYQCFSPQKERLLCVELQGAQSKRWGVEDICRIHEVFCAPNPDTRQFASTQQCIEYMESLPLYSAGCGPQRPLAVRPVAKCSFAKRPRRTVAGCSQSLHVFLDANAFTLTSRYAFISNAMDFHARVCWDLLIV